MAGSRSTTMWFLWSSRIGMPHLKQKIKDKKRVIVQRLRDENNFGAARFRA